MKTLLIFLLILLGIGIFLSVFNHFYNQPKEFDCSQVGLDVMYFKPSEVSQIPKFLNNHPSGIAVIPESNQVNANTEILNCENFRYEDYVELEW